MKFLSVKTGSLNLVTWSVFTPHVTLTGLISWSPAGLINYSILRFSIYLKVTLTDYFMLYVSDRVLWNNKIININKRLFHIFPIRVLTDCSVAPLHVRCEIYIIKTHKVKSLWRTVWFSCKNLKTTFFKKCNCRKTFYFSCLSSWVLFHLSSATFTHFKLCRYFFNSLSSGCCKFSFLTYFETRLRL